MSQSYGNKSVHLVMQCEHQNGTKKNLISKTPNFEAGVLNLQKTILLRYRVLLIKWLVDIYNKEIGPRILL